MSLSLVPILLTKKKAPKFKKIIGMKIAGIISLPIWYGKRYFVGSLRSAMFALIAVYAAAMNFSIFEISFVTFLVAISCYLTMANWKTI